MYHYFVKIGFFKFWSTMLIVAALLMNFLVVLKIYFSSKYCQNTKKHGLNPCIHRKHTHTHTYICIQARSSSSLYNHISVNFKASQTPIPASAGSPVPALCNVADRSVRWDKFLFVRWGLVRGDGGSALILVWLLCSWDYSSYLVVPTGIVTFVMFLKDFLHILLIKVDFQNIFKFFSFMNILLL